MLLAFICNNFLPSFQIGVLLESSIKLSILLPCHFDCIVSLSFIKNKYTVIC